MSFFFSTLNTLTSSSQQQQQQQQRKHTRHAYYVTLTQNAIPTTNSRRIFRRSVTASRVTRSTLSVKWTATRPRSSGTRTTRSCPSRTTRSTPSQKTLSVTQRWSLRTRRRVMPAPTSVASKTQNSSLNVSSPSQVSSNPTISHALSLTLHLSHTFSNNQQKNITTKTIKIHTITSYFK